MLKVFTPSELGGYIETVLKRDNLLRNVIVEGEVSDYTINQKTGHHYFTLKDAQLPNPQEPSYGRRESAVLKGILFQGNAGFVQSPPEPGSKIRAKGQIATYSGQSVYQLQCLHYEKVGLGEAHQIFLQMQEHLGQHGFFDPRRKQPIKPYPKAIALVTASTGDAVHDMIDALQGRCPGVQLKIVPTPVQGVHAEDQIAQAIDWINRHQVADVIVVGRGGGSAEDLKAYNAERLAQAIFHSRIPVISAVGHEQDRVISDRVADAYVATPSRVKDLFLDVPKELGNLNNAQHYLDQLFFRSLEQREQLLEKLTLSPVFQDPAVIFREKESEIQGMSFQLERLMENKLQEVAFHCEKLDTSLEDLSPKKVLSRGYAVAQHQDGQVISSVKQLKKGDRFVLTLEDGEVTCVVGE